MYSLWNDNLNNVQESVRKGYTSKKPLSFSTSGRGVVDKFKSEELDALTSQYKDEKAFAEALSKYGDKYIKDPNYHKIIMVSTRGNRTYEHDIIYDDLLLHKVAKEVISKKSKKTPNEKYSIDNSDKVIEFINYIKRLATNKDTKDFLLNPLKLNQSDENLIALDRLIDDDIIKDGVIIKRGLRSLLVSYSHAIDSYNKCQQIEESTLEVESEIHRINHQISEYIRSDYRVFRNLIAWENRFYKTLEFLKDNSHPNQSSLYHKLIQEIKVQRFYRNGIITQEGLNAFYDELDYIYEYKKETPATIQNEEMLNLYNDGGIEEVMSNYSIADIYSSKENYETAVKLGIISKNKK